MADILHEEIFSSLNFRGNHVQEWGGGGGGGGGSCPPCPPFSYTTGDGVIAQILMLRVVAHSNAL